MRLTRQTSRGPSTAGRQLKTTTADVTRISGIRVNARWWREFLGYDPVPDYAKITAPSSRSPAATTCRCRLKTSTPSAAWCAAPSRATSWATSPPAPPRSRPDGPGGYRRALRQPVSAAVLGSSPVGGRPWGGQPGSPAGRLTRMTRRAAKDEGDAGPSATLRSQHAEATRRAVLDAARTLFGLRGYAQTSVDEIADAALVTVGARSTTTSRTRRALFRAVYAEVEADAQARSLRAADQGRPAARPDGGP